MNSKRSKRNLFTKSLMSGLMMACSVAVADQPQPRQITGLEGLPTFDDSRNEDFVAWTDEVFGSGVVKEASDAETPAHFEAPAYFPESPRIAQRNEGVVVPSDLDPATEMTANAATAQTPLQPATINHLNPATPIDLTSPRIAFQKPDQKDSKTKPSTKRINLMDSDMSHRTPDVVGGRLELPAIEAASTSITSVGNGRAPDGFRSTEDSPVSPLPEQGIQRSPTWGWSFKAWNAPNTFSHPLYFEDRMLERHGHERFPHLTPVVAGMRFFTTVPMLPYLATVNHPLDCEYTLGYYRSGTCVPAYLQRPPYERRAVIAEAAAVSGAIIAFP